MGSARMRAHSSVVFTCVVMGGWIWAHTRPTKLKYLASKRLSTCNDVRRTLYNYTCVEHIK